MSGPQPTTGAGPAASLPRIFAACVYDGLLSVAILFAAAAAAVAATGGTAVSAGDPLFRLYLLAVAFPYYGFCWTHGGQTLGMRTWRVKAVSARGGKVGWVQALGRYLAAVLSVSVLGLGFVWIAVDPHRRSWHDLLSATRLVVAPSPKAS